jgi:hypothetical protein
VILDFGFSIEGAVSCQLPEILASAQDDKHGKATPDQQRAASNG